MSHWPPRFLASSATTRSPSPPNSTRNPAWASCLARFAISSFNALSTVSSPLTMPRRASSANTCSYKDLSAAVDVYSDWVDACDAVAKEHGEGQGAQGVAPPRAPPPVRRPSARAEDEEEDINDDDILNNDGLGGYRGAGIVADDEEY